jgi:metal-sulfur cluster biosynthetic enzyme
MEEKTFPEIINNSPLNIDEIIRLLKNIFDPEIHYSIYDMGLIYKIEASNNNIDILMTLTTPNCPEAVSLPDKVNEVLSEAFPDYKISVEITFEPMWTVDNMTDDIKLGLGLL